MKFRITIMCIFLSMLIVSSVCAQKVYYWKDKKGVMNATTTPPPDNIKKYDVDSYGKPDLPEEIQRYQVEQKANEQKREIERVTRRIVWPALRGGPVIGGPYHGSVLPGKEGGMVVGGPLNGSAWPDSHGGMIVGGPLNGTVWPSSKGGTIVGGPLNGTVWPPAAGGLIVGGSLNGYLVVP